MNTSILSIFLIILTIFTPTWTLVTSINDSLPYHDPKRQAGVLQNIQNQYQRKLKLLDQQSIAVQTLIDNQQISQQAKTTQLSEKMSEQRNHLQQIQNFLKVPYHLQTCSCGELSQGLMNNITSKVQSLSTQINQLQTTAVKCSGDNCAKTKELNQSINVMKHHLSSLSDIVGSQCQKRILVIRPELATGLVDLSHTLVKDQLVPQDENRTWKWGSVTRSQYKLKMFELSSKYNTTGCPLSRPFANIKQNTCLKCSTLSQCIFNVGDRKCQPCPELAASCVGRQYFNISIHNCQTCPQGTHPNQTSRNCTACPNNGQYFNFTAKKCEKCPANQQYVFEAEKCEPCKKDQFYNSQTYQCIKCPKGQFYDKINKKCEYCPGRRYFSLKQQKCMKCPLNTQLNFTTMTCEPCKSDQHYNSTMGICFSCQNGSTYNANTNSCHSKLGGMGTCPASHPYYNFYLKRCQACQQGFVFSFELSTCVRNNNIGVCPIAHPLYDYQTHECKQCPKGTKYNPYFHECDSVENNTSSSS